MSQETNNRVESSGQFIRWNQRRFSINDVEIDNQHKRLIDICNSLYESHRKGESSEGIRNALLAIVEYARTHFKDEEKLMMDIEYPGLDRQKMQHKQFIRKITDILQRLRDGNAVSAFNLLAFLKDWIEDHIQMEDKLIGRFITAREAKSGTPGKK